MDRFEPTRHAREMTIPLTAGYDGFPLREAPVALHRAPDRTSPEAVAECPPA